MLISTGLPNRGKKDYARRKGKVGKFFVGEGDDNRFLVSRKD